MDKLLVKLYKSTGKVLAGFYPVGRWGDRRNPVEVSRAGIMARRASDSTDWWSAYGLESGVTPRSDYDSSFMRRLAYCHSIVLPEESEV